MSEQGTPRRRSRIPLALSKDWETLLLDLREHKYIVELKQGNKCWCVLLAKTVDKLDGTLALLAQIKTGAKKATYELKIGMHLAKWLRKKTPSSLSRDGEAMIITHTWGNLPFIFAWAYFPIPPDIVGGKVELPRHMIEDLSDNRRRGSSQHRVTWGPEEKWTPYDALPTSRRDKDRHSHPILRQQRRHVGSNSTGSSRLGPDFRNETVYNSSRIVPGYLSKIHHYSAFSEGDRRHAQLSTSSPFSSELGNSYRFPRMPSSSAHSYEADNDMGNHRTASRCRGRLLSPEDGGIQTHRDRHSSKSATYIPRQRRHSYSGFVTLSDDHKSRPQHPIRYDSSGEIPHRASVQESYIDDRGRSYGPDHYRFEMSQSQQSHSQIPSRARRSTGNYRQPFSQFRYLPLADYQFMGSGDGRHDISHDYGRYSKPPGPRGWAER
ncbi:hypothetical protein GGR57DRAFT_40383 [Xylariaceae sp. FL1272]|nr:hypothetical protein GGR57DRAFT_40383 [Xylariaceae sp. FL1272]